MITGTGIDLVEVARIRELLERHAERFKQRTFTAGEIAYCDACADPAMHYAALWSEAGVNWTDIEVTRAESGRPSLVFHQNAAKVTSGLRAHLSLSHTKEHAMAQVVLEDA